MQTHEINQTFTALLEKVRVESLGDLNSDSEQPVLSTETLLTLSSLFPSVLNSALHILDHGKVIKFVCQDSRRHFFRVQESSMQS